MAKHFTDCHDFLNECSILLRGQVMYVYKIKNGCRTVFFSHISTDRLTKLYKLGYLLFQQARSTVHRTRTKIMVHNFVVAFSKVIEIVLFFNWYILPSFYKMTLMFLRVYNVHAKYVVLFRQTSGHIRAQTCARCDL